MSMSENLRPIPKGLTNPLGIPTANLVLFEKLPSDVMNNNILVQLDVKSSRIFRNRTENGELSSREAAGQRRILHHPGSIPQGTSLTLLVSVPEEWKNSHELALRRSLKNNNMIMFQVKLYDVVGSQDHPSPGVAVRHASYRVQHSYMGQEFNDSLCQPAPQQSLGLRMDIFNSLSIRLGKSSRTAFKRCTLAGWLKASDSITFKSQEDYILDLTVSIPDLVVSNQAVNEEYHPCHRSLAALSADLKSSGLSYNILLPPWGSCKVPVLPPSDAPQGQILIQLPGSTIDYLINTTRSPPTHNKANGK
ncbi:hypothetical protein FGLOB1_12343 [Fusarium globosum]|uniref:Uncharacterized protein n=1 Tax=Fusarium globosum TaxID=78864 RepID=A0A8H5XRC1_9HYPO|nr:hypothetical protein FGLOB1_12343 [Fusarium globosum]